MKTWIGVLTALVAVETLIIGIYCCSELEVDSNSPSVLISALGVLITFVVAWQIWQTIASREEIREAKEAKEEIHNLSLQLTRSREYMQGLFCHTEGNNMVARQWDVMAIAFYARATTHYIRGNADINTEILQAIDSLEAAIGNMENYSTDERNAIRVQIPLIRQSFDEAIVAIRTMEQNMELIRSRFEQVRTRFENLIRQLQS